MKFSTIVIFIGISISSFSQRIELGFDLKKEDKNDASIYNFKQLRENDSFKIDNYHFYKISKDNFHSYFTDTNTLAIHYSNWCSGYSLFPAFLDSFQKANPQYKVYLLNSDMMSKVKYDIAYLKKHQWKNDVLFLDWEKYKKGNWAKKYDKFIADICPNCQKIEGCGLFTFIRKNKYGKIEYLGSF